MWIVFIPNMAVSASKHCFICAGLCGRQAQRM